MNFNIIQELGISSGRTLFTVGKTSVGSYRRGNIISMLDGNVYIVENVGAAGIVLRELNWWGKLLLKFGWLI